MAVLLLHFMIEPFLAMNSVKVLNKNPLLFYHFSYYLVPSSIYESVALTVIEESDKMNLASKLASNVIKKAPSGPVRISYRRFIN